MRTKCFTTNKEFILKHYKLSIPFIYLSLKRLF
jgi:hypothetical protein